jgi:NitT/TauT family transport system permease protein
MTALLWISGPRNRRIASLRRMLNLRVIWRPIAAAVVALVAWELFVRVNAVPETILPAPSTVLLKLTRFFPLLVANVGQTSIETVIAFIASCAIGCALGMVLSYSKFLSECLYPNLIFLQIVPKIAVAPLFIAWLGIASESRIAFSVFLSFFPVFIAT